ncbi:hypothetical protein D5R40_34640 [Okeania hirsuta]|uniref:Uncharacterized protein n=1 Tax=Okeania hirsuta TaxID=1458930 RepID=A0A3N6NAX6_9CYAN|nr:hypothetical protein [Okeania hirsuta]RQH13039.1 hypothetical protein D5R40_34640 [Okeania hirsuta]
MNWQEKAETFWSQGYLLLEDFFQEAFMDELNAEVLAHFGLNPDWEHSLDFIEKSELMTEALRRFAAEFCISSSRSRLRAIPPIKHSEIPNDLSQLARLFIRYPGR